MHFLIAILLLTGCSGYRFTQQENPLSQYGIQSLSVPMFYNYSNLPDVSSDFTRETYSILMNYPGLKLKTGYHEDTDAVMIGIIKSPERLAETLNRGSSREAKQVTPNAVTGRERFSIDATTRMSVALQVIVIKKPTEEEIALLKSGIGDKVKLTSRVIFNELIPLNVQFTREYLDDAGVQVVSTQNAGVQRKTIDSLARQAAISIRDMILYAF